jgi:hypothetical protein
MSIGNRTHQRPDSQRPGKSHSGGQKAQTVPRRQEQPDQRDAERQDEEYGEGKPGTPGVKGE